MGEQVAGAPGYGWFDGVRADLARESYASRGVDIPSCAIDAPHQRNRLYWIAVDAAAGADVQLQPDAYRGRCSGRPEDAERESFERAAIERALLRNGSWWSDAEWIVSPLDGKARRAKPGIPFLVDGFPGRVDLWRVGGNAIVPQLAAEVIRAFIETDAGVTS